jgi:hypothetical protein
VIYFLKYWKYGAAALVLVGLFAWIRGTGYDAAETKYKAQIATMVAEAEEARAEAIAAAQEKELLWQALESTEAALALKARAETKFVTNTVVKWKVRYAKNPDAGKCVVPDEFVRVYDSAALNRVPEATPDGPQPDGATRQITDIEILDITTQNYATCHGWADQLRHIQAREAALEEATP